jgi:hypothetical protein
MTFSNLPDTYTPINNYIWYRATDPLYYENDFKYIYDVRSLLQTVTASTIKTQLGRYKIPAGPDTSGVFSIHKQLKSELVTALYITHSNIFVDYTSIVRAGIRYGIQYIPSSGNTFSTYNSGGFLGLSFSTIGATAGTAIYQPNDNITLLMYDQVINTSYNGTFTASIVSGNTVRTTKTIGITSSTPEYGTVTNILRLSGTSSDIWAYNGTRQYNERTTNFGSRFTIEGRTASQYQFLTNYIGYKPLYINQPETIQFLYDEVTTMAVNGPVNAIRVTQYDTGLNVIGSTTSLVTFGEDPKSNRYMSLGIGVPQLLDMGLTISTAASFYQVELGYYFISGSQWNTTYATTKREITYRDCIYDNIRIMFLNPHGGWEFWNFNKDSKNITSVNRTEFRKVLPWNYNIGDRGNTILSTQATETYTANTDWLSEYDYMFLKELVTSPEVYILDEDDNNRPYPIIVQDTSFVSKSKYREKIFNMTINYRMAYDINLQSL